MHNTLFAISLLTAARVLMASPAALEQRQTVCSPLELILGMSSDVGQCVC